MEISNKTGKFLGGIVGKKEILLFLYVRIRISGNKFPVIFFILLIV